MAHPHEDLVRAGYAAFGRGDIQALLDDFFAPGIIWHFPGRSQLAGDHAGVEAVGRHFRSIGELSGGTHRLELHDVIPGDDHTVALHVARAERGDKKLEVNVVTLFHISDGRVTEAWTVHYDLHTFDDFWT